MNLNDDLLIDVSSEGSCSASPPPLHLSVLGVVPELCQCRDLELDCDDAQLGVIPVVAINVTMM